MKSLSASIVALGGLAVFAASPYLTNVNSSSFQWNVGLAVAIVGLIGWTITLRRTDEK